MEVDDLILQAQSNERTAERLGPDCAFVAFELQRSARMLRECASDRVFGMFASDVRDAAEEAINAWRRCEQSIRGVKGVE